MFKRGVENLVELYLPGDWLGFCLAPKPKIRTLENCAKRGQKSATELISPSSGAENLTS
jgi:hypothetical protein